MRILYHPNGCPGPTYNVNNTMNQPKSFASAVKEALAKKHAAAHPDAKTNTKTKVKKTKPPLPAGKPVHKASGRGG